MEIKHFIPLQTTEVGEASGSSSEKPPLQLPCHQNLALQTQTQHKLHCLLHFKIMGKLNITQNYKCISWELVCEILIKSKCNQKKYLICFPILKILLISYCNDAFSPPQILDYAQNSFSCVQTWLIKR